MVKIIKGVYGMKTGARVVPVTAEDEPISLSPEQESRLVRLGVAEYASAPAQMESGEVGSLSDKTKNELLEIAKELGIKPGARETKEELIQRIESAQEEQMQEEQMPEVFEDLPEDQIPGFEAAVQ